MEDWSGNENWNIIHSSSWVGKAVMQDWDRNENLNGILYHSAWKRKAVM